jgi:predicted transcriptional regulator
MQQSGLPRKDKSAMSTETQDESGIEKTELLALTTEIVSSHVANNAVATSDLPDLIHTIYTKLHDLASEEQEKKEELVPAVPIKKSVTDDYIICLEDGKKLKMLKRHLATAYNMTPEQYRAKWGLRPDYPMVAPSYARKRQALANKIGLGRKPKSGSSGSGSSSSTKSSGAKSSNAKSAAPAKAKA